MKIKYSIIIIIILGITPFNTEAGEKAKPLWEFGVMGGGFSLPHYIGSDQQYTYPFVLPYAIYRGKFLQMGRRGARGIFFSGTRFSMDIGLSGNLPVKSDNNDAREGMPDLQLAGQIGPRINFRINKKEARITSLLRLPFRGVWSIGGKTGYIRGEQIGWIVEPNILIGFDTKDKQWLNYMVMGFKYASKKYNQTYYGVEPSYKTTTRPAYDADEGLLSTFLTLSSFYRINNRIGIGGFFKWHNLAHGILKDSPLVRQKDSYSIGLAMTWSLWQSKETASQDNIVHPDEGKW